MCLGNISGISLPVRDKIVKIGAIETICKVFLQRNHMVALDCNFERTVFALSNLLRLPLEHPDTSVASSLQDHLDSPVIGREVLSDRRREHHIGYNLDLPVQRRELLESGESVFAGSQGVGESVPEAVPCGYCRPKQHLQDIQQSV